MWNSFNKVKKKRCSANYAKLAYHQSTNALSLDREAPGSTCVTRKGKFDDQRAFDNYCKTAETL